MQARADTAEHRTALYRRFSARNRWIGVLRIAVPVGAALAMMVPVAQVLIASLRVDFSIGRLGITRDALVIDAPDYSGVAANGIAYRVMAGSARAGLTSLGRIGLSDAQLQLRRLDGVELFANAVEADLDTGDQVVIVPGTARVGDSTGADGSMERVRFNWDTMILEAEGPVDFTFGDGSHLAAQTLHYDANSQVWTFRKATLTVRGGDDTAAQETAQ